MHKSNSKVSNLISLLKRKYITNLEACIFLRSGTADRTLRYIQANPPEGYTCKSKWTSFKEGKQTVRYKLYKLIRIK